jgi:hypothetical protein
MELVKDTKSSVPVEIKTRQEDYTKETDVKTKYEDAITRIAKILYNYSFKKGLELETDIRRNVDSKKESSSSDFIINSFGGLTEFWDKTQIYPSKIIELSEHAVTLELLINYEKKEYELRVFKRSLIEGKISLSPETIILVKTFERPGKFVFEFEEAKSGLYEKYFEKKESDIEGISPRRPRR